MGSTTSHHFATPHNNNTTSPQLKTTRSKCSSPPSSLPSLPSRPLPLPSMSPSYIEASPASSRILTFSQVQWHCSIWHCHGHRFRQQPRWLRSRPRHCWRCRSCFVRMPINDSLKLELSGGKGV